MRILICDDAAPVRQTLARALLLDGRTVVTEARSAEEALDLLALTPFDVVVMDHDLPAMKGLDAVRHLRSSGATVAILMFTGDCDLEIAEDLVDGHLVKGQQSLADVVAKIRRLAVEAAPAIRSGTTTAQASGA